MATGLASWSSTAAANATADANVNWAEGQAPSSVNDSARAMMASLRKWLNDICAATSTGGTSTAYTVTTQQGFASLSALAGQIVGFTPHTNCGATVTLAVDGLAARPLRPASNTEFTASQLKGGSPLLVTFNGTDSVYYAYNMATGLVALSGLSAIASVSVIGNSSNVSSTPTTINLETPVAFTNATSIGITTAGIAYSKIQNVASVSLLGCGSTTSTAITEIKLGSTLKFTNASTLDVNTVSASVIVGAINLASGGTSADLSATGGAGQVLKQLTGGGAVTVGTLSYGEIAGSTTGTGSAVFAGTPTLVTPVIGSATGNSLSTSGDITANGTIAVKNSAQGIGYITPAGGSVTQVTNKLQAVTANFICGTIVTASTGLGPSSTNTFIVSNSRTSTGDVIVTTMTNLGTAGTYDVRAEAVASNSFKISLTNVNTTTTVSEAVGINFAILRACSN